MALQRIRFPAASSSHGEARQTIAGLDNGRARPRPGHPKGNKHSPSRLHYSIQCPSRQRFRQKIRFQIYWWPVARTTACGDLDLTLPPPPDGGTPFPPWPPASGGCEGPGGRGLRGWVRSALSRAQLTHTIWDRVVRKTGAPLFMATWSWFISRSFSPWPFAKFPLLCYSKAKRVPCCARDARQPF